jgi:Sulfotransferase domain
MNMGNIRRPDFFIVGAPKCGTTAMQDYLGQHPEIFMPEMKEAHFFGSDLDAPVYLRDEKKYLALFAKARNEKRVGEASVYYLYSRKAAGEIKEFSPAASIIIMLRNPVEMIYSLHSQRLYNGNEDIEDFQAALDAEEDRKKGLRLPKDRHLLAGLFYREVAKYSNQVQRYIDVFGREKIKVIIFDEFKRNTAQVYRDTCEFLGVDPTFEPVIRVINGNKGVRSVTYRNLIFRPSLLRTVARRVIPDVPRRRLIRTLERVNLKYEPRPPMNPELKERLKEEFRLEVERLSQVLDRDLTYWSRS